MRGPINPLFTFVGAYTGPAPNVAEAGHTNNNANMSSSGSNGGSTTTTAQRGNATAVSHADPAIPHTAARTTTAAESASSPASAVSADLLRSLTAAVQESLAAYLYPDAIELAQRLFNLVPSYTHLHLLAHCHTLSGAVGTAYRLLRHHYPFFETHVRRPRTAAGPRGSNFVFFDRDAKLPLDGRRTWSSTDPANAIAMSNEELFDTVEHGELVDLSYETVDLKAQWECQYLLGVCCYRSKHYEDGMKMLSQLLYVKFQLDTAAAALRKQQQQQQQREQQLGGSGNGADVERQLRSYTFVTEARVSQVLYWLGLCEKHRQRSPPPRAADYFKRSFAAQPTRLDAFREYVRIGWPTEAAVQELLAVKEPLAEEEEEEEGEEEEEEEGNEESRSGESRAEGNLRAGERKQKMSEREEEEETARASRALQQQRPPRRRGRELAEREDEEHASAARTSSPRLPTSRGSGRGSSAKSASFTLDAPPLTASQRRCLQQHLQPFLRAIFLATTYRCSEAIDALQNLLRQQEQQQQQQQTTTTAATSGGASETAQTCTRYPRLRSPAERGRVISVPGASLALSPLLLQHLALAQFHNGDVQDSAETFDRLLRAAPWDLTNTALIYYSTALWHLKSESALGSLAQRLTDAEPFHPTTLCVVANAYSLIKDPRDALVMLKRAVQLDPTLAYAHALYGYELLGQDNKAEAEKAFKTALAVDRTLYIAYAGLGERFIHEEQVDRAQEYYREAVRINPTPAIVNRFALTYHRQNTSTTYLKYALRLYSESLQRHPNNVTARRQRTDVLLRLDRPTEALEELKALLVQCPGEAAVYMTLAECMVCLRRPQEALQHYQTAMHLDPRRASYVQGCIDRLVAANML